MRVIQGFRVIDSIIFTLMIGIAILTLTYKYYKPQAQETVVVNVYYDTSREAIKQLSKKGINLSNEEIKSKITKEVKKYNLDKKVGEDVVYVIRSHYSVESGAEHFENGQLKLSPIDSNGNVGIGISQITVPYGTWVWNGYDLRDPYDNIAASVQLWNAKWESFDNIKDKKKRLFLTVKAYNGSGPKATKYAKTVLYKVLPKVKKKYDS